MNTTVIAAFYKFVLLENFEDLREPWLKLMRELGIKGTLILAKEGINGSFAGDRQAMDAFYEVLRADARMTDLFFRETYDARNPFDKAKVKLRKEIVTMGIQDIDPNAEVGEYLSPEEWNELLVDPDVVLIDTRNDYEFEVGTFQNAVNPDIENFRDFPDYVEKNMMDKKDKKIAMFCTGGIRCEKSTAYMKKMGFDKVYHLKGGIINYLQEIDKNNSLWDGYCFVFDDRVAIDADLNRVYPQLPEKN